MRTSKSGEHTRFSKLPELGGLELLHAAYRKQKFTPHFHKGHVIGVIESGNLGFDYRGERLVASQGEINIADPGEVHNGTSVSEIGWQYRMFYFQPGQLDQICNDITGKKQEMPFFKKGVIKDKGFAAALWNLHLILLDPEVSLLEKESRFQSVFSQFLIKHGKNRISQQSIPSEPRAIKRVKSYISDHYNTDVSLSDLSDFVQLSRYYLLRLFAKQTGLTPHAYLNLIRVEKAKQMMDRKVSIIDTAHATGFFDQSHLNRIFKKYTGITPGQYMS
jgi:AraC-like DNA-binding protein